MTRAPEALLVDRLPSPLGTLHVVCDGQGRLRALDFEEYETRMQRLLGRHYGEASYTLRRQPTPLGVRTALEAFFAGALEAIDAIEVRTGGTDFQRRVWVALRRIPAGTTTSYGQLASALGQPGASRAVGLANGSNPIPIVVPCHRVIGADGTLTGYGGGIERKRALLAHEREWLARRASQMEKCA